jgi:hypothetical protein
MTRKLAGTEDTSRGRTACSLVAKWEYVPLSYARKTQRRENSYYQYTLHVGDMVGTLERPTNECFPDLNESPAPCKMTIYLFHLLVPFMIFGYRSLNFRGDKCPRVSADQSTMRMSAHRQKLSFLCIGS